MLPHRSVPLLFTSYLAVSHITLAVEESEVIVFGLYGSLLHNELKELVMQCNFTQMNDLLQEADYVSYETIEQLSDIVTSGVTGSQTIDVTDSGGINFNLLFCLERIEAGTTGLKPADAYFLHAFIRRDSSVAAFEMGTLRGDEKSFADYYLTVLSIQYDFYLYFINGRMNNGEAISYAGLQDELIFELAKKGHEVRKNRSLKLTNS